MELLPESLKEWLVDEVEYRIRAAESRDGLSANYSKRNTNRKQLQSFNTGRVANPLPCLCCTVIGHKLCDCPKFKAYTTEQRWQLAKKKKLCFRCLAGKHQGKNCMSSKICGVGTCEKTHHPLLHSQVAAIQSQVVKRSFHTVPDNPDEPKEPKPSQVKTSDQQTYTTTLTSTENSEETFSFRTVPVWLKANGKK